MSEKQDAIIKKRLKTARKLIQEGRYGAARYILEQVDHPGAGTMLKELEGRPDKKKPTTLVPEFMTMFAVIGAGIIIAGILIVLAFSVRLINASRVPAFDDFDETGQIILTGDEILYANLAMYCYDYTGYGGELCLDWTEYVLRDYRTELGNCLDPMIDADIPEDEDYVEVGRCLSDAGIPPPL